MCQKQFFVSSKSKYMYVCNQLRDCELGAIVNRDLSRRIRQVNGITAHKQVVRSDIRISARVALHLDTKVGLWSDEQAAQPQQPVKNKLNTYQFIQLST